MDAAQIFQTFCAGAISITICSPLDVIQVRRQVGLRKHMSIHTAAARILKEEGFRGFFRGLSYSLPTRPCFWAIQYPIYKSIMPSDGGVIENAICAYTAAFVASTLVNPLFVVKTRLQTYHVSGMKISSSMVWHILKEEGAAGLWKGVKATYIHNVRLLILFPLKDRICESLIPYSAGASTFLSTFLASGMTGLLMYPAEIVRTNQRNDLHNPSFMSVARRLWAGGFSNLYRGAYIYTFRTSLSMAIIMALSAL